MTLRFHDPFLCAGETCCIHNPSDHPLRDAPKVWRSLTSQFMERMCPCGIGHPDPDSLDYLRIAGLSEETGLHGCCREICCGDPFAWRTM